MRRNSQKGFTLIELLIVIAIIGILAAVLIPQLMGARASAQARAAQAHGSNVYTAHIAWLASNVNDDAAAAVAALGGDCEAEANVDGLGWREPPANITCSVSAHDTDPFDFTVETSGGGQDFVNGEEAP